MADSFFTPTDDPHTWQPTRATVGPWAPTMQHGGPPSALVVREAERLGAAAADGPVDALRVSLDFFGPVTTDPVRVSGEVVRAGRSVTLVDVHLEQDGRTALRGSVWLVRRDAEGATPAVPGPESGLPGPDELAPFEVWHFPYIEHFDWRVILGSTTQPGPAQVWARPLVPLVPGEEPTGLQRAVLIGDSGSGVSAELDWSDWSFVNVSLDVQLLRPRAADWLLLDARTRLAGTGTGLTLTTLHDRAGVVGHVGQNLVVGRRG
ncbi:MAG TPA: thioesterase family protein [Oryzihumus sp.]|nr:thioesterase family protein [Oryzihumus sp.]